MSKKQEKVIIDIVQLPEEKALNSAVMDYITIKSAIKGLELELNVQKSIIMEYAKTSGIEGIKFMDKIINYIPEITTKILNKDKFKLNLLNSGVKAEIISKCEAKSTEEKPKAGYLKLSEIKPKK